MLLTKHADCQFSANARTGTALQLYCTCAHARGLWLAPLQEAADAINWAKENDGKASEMAAAAQAVAKRYLHNKAIMCYWLTLLQVGWCRD